MSQIKTSIQSFGRFLSAMIMPNIGAFIGWGFMTALFIPTGWLPNENLAALIGPMVTYLLPLLMGYTGGKLVGGDRGAVCGAMTTMGLIVGADIPMFLGAMIVGPLGGFVIKKFDAIIHGKIKAGFEMFVNNFLLGILGMFMAILAYFIIQPCLEIVTKSLGAGVVWIVKANLLPLVSIIVEPAKILFLNNAINHGVFTPLGAEQAAAAGKSVLYLIETNPGPGLGVLLAYLVGRDMASKSAYGASVIHFFGGIHEIYFPYILMKPRLILAVIAGGMSGVGFNMIVGNGLTGPPSPGSIFALALLSTKGLGIVLTLVSVAIATAVSFTVASLLKLTKKEGDLEEVQNKVTSMKSESKGVDSSTSTVNKIIVACDAGMGSSAIGATVLRDKVTKAGLNIEVTNKAINDLTDGDIIITQSKLTNRAKKQLPNAQHLSIDSFMNTQFYNQLTQSLKKQK